MPRTEAEKLLRESRLLDLAELAHDKHLNAESEAEKRKHFVDAVAFLTAAGHYSKEQAAKKISEAYLGEGPGLRRKVPFNEAVRQFAEHHLNRRERGAPDYPLTPKFERLRARTIWSLLPKMRKLGLKRKAKESFINSKGAVFWGFGKHGNPLYLSKKDLPLAEEAEAKRAESDPVRDSNEFLRGIGFERDEYGVYRHVKKTRPLNELEGEKTRPPKFDPKKHGKN